jgi:hypothetical protein
MSVIIHTSRSPEPLEIIEKTGDWYASPIDEDYGSHREKVQYLSRQERRRIFR